MLEPQTRDLLTEHLRPPVGYQLDYGVGTTFSLDLLALLITPLSFALFDWEDEKGQAAADITAIMQALRSYAGKMAIFCQSGRIAVPRKDQPLFLHLERCVFQARAPRPDGLFHPKMWLLRFTAEDEPVQYRFLCMSRNLTFDRAWDVCFRSDGELTERRRPIAGMAPLSSFVGALPGMAGGAVPETVKAKIRQMQGEVEHVDFEIPDGAADFSFLPLGVDGTPTWPFDGDIRRMMVVSPFIGGRTLTRLAEIGDETILVSRLESLQQAGATALEGFARTAVLNEAADLDALAADEESTSSLQGLHAKIYAADLGSGASVWVGSANATDAAFNNNVELLVRLDGSKARLGVKTLLEPSDPSTPSLGNLLVDVDIEDPPEVDEADDQALAAMESARLSLAGISLTAEVEPGERERFSVRLRSAGAVELKPGVHARCWPIRVGEGSAVTIVSAVDATFSLSKIELTSFFAFEVGLDAGGVPPVRFVLNAELLGAPEDRDEAVLRDVLRDKGRVLKFLLFLLADGSTQEAASLLVGSANGEADGGAGRDLQLGLPLFEALMRALVRDPRKLDQVENVIRDLSKTSEGEDLIPDGFAEIWEPILEARRAITP